MSCKPRFSLWTHFTLERRKRKSGRVYAGLSNHWPPRPPLHPLSFPSRLSWELGRLVSSYPGNREERRHPEGVTRCCRVLGALVVRERGGPVHSGQPWFLHFSHTCLSVSLQTGERLSCLIENLCNGLLCFVFSTNSHI